MKFVTNQSKLLASVMMATFLAGSTLAMAGQSSSEARRMAPQTTTRTATQTAPQRQQAIPARSRLSTRKMMLKLKPHVVIPGQATSYQGINQKPPKYEIADCGTDASPMICCHHEAGDGSTCNLFKILCKNAGGTAQGGGSEAACSDWPEQ